LDKRRRERDKGISQSARDREEKIEGNRQRGETNERQMKETEDRPGA
jgi:hypothetical protein